MKEIRGNAKNIRSLLSSSKFSIDYYQREYRWETKQISDLLEDLCEEFLDNYKDEHERSAAEHYDHYFLGSIIISDRDGKKFIIDGQQRLTTITLLLIYIYRQLHDDKEKVQLDHLIFSQKFGTRSFNLDVDERAASMNALFSGQYIEENDQPESIVNILRCYQDIEKLFPANISGDVLPFFSDWFIENVYLVEITATTDTDAYAIFETMNDRGLSLTPTDMLKGYLLANITEPNRRNSANDIWRHRVSSLREIEKDEDADAIKSWLRSQYAKTIHEGKKGAKPRDFSLIGTEFHRWVRDHKKMIGLKNSDSFGRFIEEDFVFYSGWYERIRKAAEELTPGLEAIHYNAQNNFTLQYPVLLAPLVRTDSDTEVLRKLRIVSIFLDILITRRTWNWWLTTYSAMQYNMFRLVILKIRGKSSAELVDILTQRLNDEAKETSFTTNEKFYLTGRNRPHIHQILARITDFIETSSKRPSRYKEYMERSKDSYEVEHIWAIHYNLHKDEFSHPSEFKEYRNRIGGLLLLPKSFNAAFGDQKYEEKYEHFFGQNLLAKSLHRNTYKIDPGFDRFIKETGLAFQAHPEFKKADLDARQKLYQTIAEKIWDPTKLQQQLET